MRFWKAVGIAALDQFLQLHIKHEATFLSLFCLFLDPMRSGWGPLQILLLVAKTKNAISTMTFPVWFKGRSGLLQIQDLDLKAFCFTFCHSHTHFSSWMFDIRKQTIACGHVCIGKGGRKNCPGLGGSETRTLFNWIYLVKVLIISLNWIMLQI